MARNLAIPFALIVTLAGLAPGAQSAPSDTLQVAAGAVLSTATNLTASHIEVHGTILRTAPGDLVLSAQTIHLWNGSKVAGWDGTRPSLVFAAKAVGAQGGRAGGIVLHAQTIIVDATGQVLAGSGGAGAAALGWSQAQGGAGGQGGSIGIDGSKLSLRGLLAPGAGGSGGAAVVSAKTGNASGRGGAGGSSGTLQLNGRVTPVRLPLLPAAPTSRDESIDPVALCNTVLKGLSTKAVNCDAAGSVQALVQVLQALIDDCNAGTRSSGDIDCAALLAEVRDAPGAALGLVEQAIAGCGISPVAATPASSAPDCGTLLATVLGLPASVLDQVKALVAQCQGIATGAPATGPCAKLEVVRSAARIVEDAVAAQLEGCTNGGAGAINVQGKDCKAIVDGIGSDVNHRDEFANSGGDGQSTTAYYTCNVPRGSDGDIGLGDGGPGGDACVRIYSDNATDGKDGSSGVINCRNGGNAGSAGDTGTANALGGTGGLGVHNGGRGGNASAISHPGNGGNGGAGGTRWFGTNCAGGNGGFGGSSGDTTATGGNGGIGLCGRGGRGGIGDATSSAGSSGAGGPGNPSGVSPPKGGTAGAATPQAGQGGQGTQQC